MMQNSEMPDSEEKTPEELNILLRLKKLREASYKEFINSLNSLQEAVESLRVMVKYLQFDLEATQRENAVLKERLQQYEEGD